MKTIKIKNAKIDEIIIRPNENIPIAVSYRLFDEEGKFVTAKQITIQKSKATEQINKIASRILEQVLGDEGL